MAGVSNGCECQVLVNLCIASHLLKGLQYVPHWDSTSIDELKSTSKTRREIGKTESIDEVTSIVEPGEDRKEKWVHWEERRRKQRARGAARHQVPYCKVYFDWEWSDAKSDLPIIEISSPASKSDFSHSILVKWRKVKLRENSRTCVSCCHGYHGVWISRSNDSNAYLVDVVGQTPSMSPLQYSSTTAVSKLQRKHDIPVTMSPIPNRRPGCEPGLAIEPGCCHWIPKDYNDMHESLSVLIWYIFLKFLKFRCDNLNVDDLLHFPNNVSKEKFIISVHMV